MMEHNDRQMILLAEPDMEESVLHRRSRAKHLKRRRRRFGFRLGISCLTMLMVIALMSVGGTFSKYTSQSPELTIPSLKAAEFHPNVSYITNTVKNAENKAEYGLEETDVVVAAFTVSSAVDGKISEVSLNCNVTLQLQGKVNVQIDDTNYQVLPGDREKLNALDHLKVKLLCNVNGGYQEISNTAPSPMALIPVAQTKNLNGVWDFALNNDFQNEKVVTCVIAIDTSEFTYSGEEAFTFSKPEGMISDENLVVTVSQFKGNN